MRAPTLPLRRLFTALLFAAGTGALVVACNADIESSCFDGNCTADTMGDPMTTAVECSADPESGDFPCDVFDVLKVSCQKCHNAMQLNGAPIDLLTCDRFHEKDCGVSQRRETAAKYVKSGFMPQGMMFPITEEQRTTLLTWLNNCAPCLPAGTGCTEAPGTLGCYKKMP